MGQRGPEYKYGSQCIRKSVSMPEHLWDEIENEAVITGQNVSEFIVTSLMDATGLAKKKKVKTKKGSRK